MPAKEDVFIIKRLACGYVWVVYSCQWVNVGSPKQTARHKIKTTRKNALWEITSKGNSMINGG
jgi:hypothetical protein